MKQLRNLNLGLLVLAAAFILIGPVSRSLGTPAHAASVPHPTKSLDSLSAGPCRAEVGLEASFQGADADRGCCLWKASGGNKCSYTNRGYCRSKAEELKVEFEFHKDKRCETVGGCPSVTPQ